MIATAVENTKTAWLGEFPAHWEVLRIKNVATINDESLSETTNPDLLIKYIDIGNVNSDGEINEIQEFKFSDAPSRARRILRKDDVIISTVRTYLKAITQISFDVENHIASTGFAVLRPNGNVTSDFLTYAVKAKYFIDSIMANSFGVSYPAINSSSLAALPILVPPKNEQAAIVQYIKAQEEKINLFIQKKQRFIELLKEQRQSVIDLAITQGTNINTKLIDSGERWIGKIPQNWQLRKLKFCVSLNSNEIEENEIDEEVFKIALENIDNWTGKFIDTGNPQFEGKGVPFKAGDVLFNKLRPYLAKAFIAKSSGFCVGELLVLTPNAEYFTSEFLFQRLMTSEFIDIVNSSTYGAKMPRASWNFIGNLKIPIPPIEEQKEIVSHIKTEIATIDTAIAKAEREIELIREYKEAMIAEAVMGKRK